METKGSALFESLAEGRHPAAGQRAHILRLTKRGHIPDVAIPARSRMAHEGMQNPTSLSGTTPLGAIQPLNHDQSSIDLRYGFLQMQIAGIELSNLHQALPIPDVKYAPLEIY
jgi:hypothetical protein